MIVFFILIIVCTHENCLDEVMLMKTQDIPSCERNSKQIYYVFCHIAMINTH